VLILFGGILTNYNGSGREDSFSRTWAGCFSFFCGMSGIGKSLL
jgi:hypothetical protein